MIGVASESSDCHINATTIVSDIMFDYWFLEKILDRVDCGLHLLLRYNGISRESRRGHCFCFEAYATFDAARPTHACQRNSKW